MIRMVMLKRSTSRSTVMRSSWMRWSISVEMRKLYASDKSVYRGRPPVKTPVRLAMRMV